MRGGTTETEAWQISKAQVVQYVPWNRTPLGRPFLSVLLPAVFSASRIAPGTQRCLQEGGVGRERGRKKGRREGKKGREGVVQLPAQGSAVGTVTPPVATPSDRGGVCGGAASRPRWVGRGEVAQAWRSRAQSWVAETADGAWVSAPPPPIWIPLCRLYPHGSLQTQMWCPWRQRTDPTSSSTSQPTGLWSWLSGRPAMPSATMPPSLCTGGRGGRAWWPWSPWRSPGPSFTCRAQC